MSKSNFKVDGIAVYARVHTPNPNAENCYTLDLVVDEATAKTLEDMGIKRANRTNKDRTISPKSHETLGIPGAVFTFSRKTITKDGKSLTPLQVLDSQGNAMKDLIGNGSKVRVYGNTYETSFKGRATTGKSMNIVQVIDLVSFSNVDKIDGGFVSGQTTTDTGLNTNEDIF